MIRSLILKNFFILLLIYFLFVSFNIEFTAWIEMLVYPYLLNNGFLLYKDLVAPYTPLMLYFLQTFTGIFGYDPKNLQILTVFIACFNAFLIFWTVKKLWKVEIAAYFGSFFYALWFFYFEGNGLWFELLQTPLIIAFFYHSYKYFFVQKTKFDLISSTLLLAVIFFTKQSGIYFSLVFFLWLLVLNIKNLQKLINPLLLLITSFLFFFFITAYIAFIGGYLSDYIRWAFQFTFFEFPLSTGHKIYPTISQIIKLGIPLIIVIPMIIKGIKLEKRALYIISLILASFMFVFPRWGLFHLQPFLALIAIGGSLYFIDFVKKQKNIGKVVLIVVLTIWIIVAGRQLQRFWDKPIRFFEPEVYKLVYEIQQKGYSDSVYIFNSPDQLYLIMNSLPAIKPYVQNFSWQMEVPGIQERIIASLQTTPPKYIIYSPVENPNGLNIGKYLPRKIFAYIEDSYRLKEKINENIWILEKN